MYINELEIYTELPSTIVLALIDNNDCVIHSMYNDGRIVVECVEDIVGTTSLTISCYSFDDSKYIDYKFEILDTELKSVQTYSTIYVLTLKGDFDGCCTCIQQAYELLDNRGENNIGSIKGFMKEKQTFCDYLYEKDREFYNRYKEQRSVWYEYIDNDEEYDVIMKDVEMAYFFVDFSDYTKIIENGCRKTIYDNIVADGVADKGVFRKEFERVYIGSEFCHNMVPDKVQLKKIMDICIMESYEITIAFPYLLENEIKKTDELLATIDETAKAHGIRIEIIINDWGMMELVRNYQNLTLVLGRLQNKRKKDPRIEYMWNYKNNSKLFQRNMLNHSLFIEKMKSMGINRFEVESHMLENECIDGKCSLHFPYYQINTSMYCTMYSECTKLNKFKQNIVYACPKYCDNYVFLYPKHLNIIGRGNSIFGFNNKMFVEKEYLKRNIEMGIDRFVYSGY